MTAFLIRPTLFLLLMLTAALGISETVHIEQPRPMLALSDHGFDDCTLPCWANIRPGFTREEGARSLLPTHLPGFQRASSSSRTNFSFAFEAAGRTYYGSLRLTNNRVNRINLQADFPLWFWLDELGKPDCALIQPVASQAAQVMLLIWELEDWAIATLLAESPRIALADLNTTTRELLVSDELRCDIPGAQPWRGSAPFWAYLGQADDPTTP